MNWKDQKLDGDKKHGSGHYGAARSNYETALSQLKSEKQFKNSDLVILFLALAATNKELCDVDTARQNAENAIEAADKSPELKTLALTELGSVLIKQNEFAEAEKKLTEAIALKKQNLESDVSIALTLNQLATVKVMMEKYSEAEPLLNQALGVFEHGSHQTGCAESLNILAVMHSKRHNYVLAETLCKRALAIRRRELGTHPDVAASLHNLGVQYLKKGQAEKSEPLWREALEIKERFLPADHPSIVLTLNHLSSACLAQRKYEEAEKFYVRSIEIQEKRAVNEEHALANAVAGLGLTYLKQGKFSEAEPYIKRSLAYLEDEGAQDVSESGLLNELFTCYIFQGKFGDALRLVPDSMRAKHTSEFNNFVDLVGQLGNLAGKLFEQRDEKKQ